MTSTVARAVAVIAVVVALLLGAALFGMLDPRVALLVAGVAIATSALTLIVITRSVAQPIARLRDAVQRGGAGASTAPAEIPGPRELRDLADAISNARDDFDARLHKLGKDAALLDAIIESLGEGVLAIGPRMNVVRINGAARTLLGIRDGVPFPIERLPQVRELRAALNEALRGTVADPRELQLGERSLVVTARPLAGDGAVLALSDLTRTRRLEAVRRDFVANVSHELRTPLTVIGGFAETLAEEGVSHDDRAHFARLIATNAQRMQRVVDELLDLSRIESGGWVPRPGTVDVGEVAADVIAANVNAARAHGIALEAQISTGAREVYADRTALRQILGNLVENAVRHTSAGSVIVFASRDEDGWSTVGVRDTGVGIEPQHLSRIFERFYRVDAARSRASGGTGLGLSIVKHLVEAHGGRVTAESAPGRGTTIAASFPPAPIPDPVTA